MACTFEAHPISVTPDMATRHAGLIAAAQCLERYSQMIRTVLDASVWMAEGYSGTSMAVSAVTITVYLETKVRLTL